MKNERLAYIVQHPGRFLLQTLRSFNDHNGLLLAGAVAYYALLSIVPLLILSLIVLSHVVDQAILLGTLQRYLEWLVPSQSRAFLDELSSFLANRDAIGGVLLVTLIFFSSLAFSSLAQAMAVIFHHRFAKRKRHFLATAFFPYLGVLVLGIALLMLTVAFNAIEPLGEDFIVLGSHEWGLAKLSSILLYVLGVAGEALLITLIYWVVPVGRIPLRHAALGGAAAALLWEAVRHLLGWYFVNLSQASVVYGTLSTAIVAMLSFEIAATILLFGAQIIAQFELLERDGCNTEN